MGSSGTRRTAAIVVAPFLLVALFVAVLALTTRIGPAPEPASAETSAGR